jgi:hypothetical protein
VATSLGVDPKTVRKYVARAEAEGFAPGGDALARADWAQLVARWFPELIDKRERSRTFVTIDAFRPLIEEMLGTNTPTTVHQRLRDEHGLAVGISSFRRYVISEFTEAVGLDKVTVLRPEVPMGEEVQIDYGYLGPWVDPSTGKQRRVWGFVMVLAASRHMFVRPVLKMDAQSWVAANVAGLEFFGGVPRRLVIDNLRTGVDRPDLYDPKLNRAYGEMATHYDCLIDPARASKPKDKPRVERPMPYVRDSFWRGRIWLSEADMQRAAVIWCNEVAGVRRHRSMEGAAPISIYLASELPALSPLPRDPFELCTWSRPKVAPDCHIKVGKVLYSVPWRLIGRRLDARAGWRTVDIFDEGVLVKTHLRAERGRRTDWSDYPPQKVAFFMRTPAWCAKRAAELGASVADVVQVLLEGGALHHLRSAQGVIGLADKYGAEHLDAACGRAIDVGDPGYRTVKGILAAGTQFEGRQEIGVPIAPAHLHGPSSLFDHLGGEVAG